MLLKNNSSDMKQMLLKYSSRVGHMIWTISPLILHVLCSHWQYCIDELCHATISTKERFFMEDKSSIATTQNDINNGISKFISKYYCINIKYFIYYLVLLWSCYFEWNNIIDKIKEIQFEFFCQSTICYLQGLTSVTYLTWWECYGVP